MSNYETGRRLEYRIRDIFRREGYLVIRAAQSKPIDLVCMRDGRSFLIECKTDRSFLGKDRKKELLGLDNRRAWLLSQSQELFFPIFSPKPAIVLVRKQDR